ncbi:metallophosphoesterase [Bacillus sp. FJAT-50079]|uniref:metallophosphoesterase n=1 Tax=Bacillus sp. FJAT-50079 TaxID=2833577 RepID=UPI001BCA1853|nr:metallophosphoesterase [Bacillus sp. FJAT-50079]MBS4209745.1 metallophosphoesterase family protein [Bacillus sp. FJAT-50079]
MEVVVIIMFCIGIIALGCYMFCQAFSNHLKQEQLSFSTFPKKFGKLTIFFISDIHRRRIHPSLIERAKNKTDIVVIGGDLAEKGVPLQRVKENIILLKQLGPVYFIWGNNDYELNYGEFTLLLESLDVIILKNKTEVLERNGEKILFVGVDDMSQYPERIDVMLNKMADISFKIVLAHNPKFIETFSDEEDVSLMLSGHTHGGQIRLFGFGPYEHGGVKQINGMTLFVSNGYGTSLLPLRLGAKPEAHLITLEHRMS